MSGRHPPRPLVPMPRRAFAAGASGNPSDRCRVPPTRGRQFHRCTAHKGSHTVESKLPGTTTPTAREQRNAMRSKRLALRLTAAGLAGLVASVLPFVQIEAASGAGSNLAPGHAASASSYNQTYVAGNINDGNQSTY